MPDIFHEKKLANPLMGHEVIKETVSISMRLSLRVTDDQHGRCGE
jgi:hypothetical protein